MSSKTFALRRLSENNIQSFWKTTSKQIFEHPWDSNKNFWLNLNEENKDPVDHNRKPLFRLRSRKQTTVRPFDATKKYRNKENIPKLSEFIDIKRKSVDRTEFRDKDWFEKYITKKRPQRKGLLVKRDPNIILGNRYKQRHENLKLLLNARTLRSQNDLEDTPTDLNASRRSSMDFSTKFKQFPKNFFKPNKNDYIIELLRSILSGSIMQSVFVKDFMVLYTNFYQYPNYRFNYRSRSSASSKCLLSKRKDVVLKTATFREYIINMYKHFDITKNGSIHKSKFGHIIKDDKENLNDSQVINTQFRNCNSPSLIYKKYKFNYLVFNRDARHFVKSMKNYNKTNKFQPSSVNVLKNKPIKPKNAKWLYKPPKQCQTAIKQKPAEKMPVKNSEATALFQKLVSITLDKSPTLEFKKEVKQKFTKAVKRTIVVTRLKNEQNTKNISKHKDLLMNKTPWVNSNKRLMIDINLLYKIPKTLDKNIKSCFNNNKENATLNKNYMKAKGFTFNKRRNTGI